jgi:hypothetical protein
MKNWRLAKSLEQLRTEINAAFPGRNKASDGSVGDTSHSARTSDHNPNDAGVVCAIDVTHDPASGCTGDRLAAALIKSRDPRIKYLIWNKRMCRAYPHQGSPAWTWNPYTGANAHQHHIHISVSADKSLYDSTEEWGLDFDIAVVRAEAEELPTIQQPVASSQPPQSTDAPAQQSNEGSGQQVVIQPNALTDASKPIVSAPGDPQQQATVGGFKSMVTSAVGWATGAGAGLIALLKDNRTLLIIAAVILVIAGILYFIRQLILDLERLKIAADPTKYSVK